MTAFVPLAAGLWATCGGIAAPRDTAVSPESSLVATAARQARDAAERSRALSGDLTKALNELSALVADCARPDWDGAGASPIDIRSVRMAARLLRALPGHAPMPEPTPEPDGHISLDWIASRHRLLSVSASPNGRLAYAWLNGSDRGHGVARFDGERVPPIILALLHEIMPA